jgi:acyl carrier protein
MDIQSVHPKVSQVICEALGRDPEPLDLESRLIDDLGAESIDYLDILFRLERAFGVKIPRGQITREARGELADDEFEKDGQVTPAGLLRLRAYLTEVPAERIRPGLKVGEIPTLFNVQTFCKLVARAVAARDSGLRPVAPVSSPGSAPAGPPAGQAGPAPQNV